MQCIYTAHLPVLADSRRNICSRFSASIVTAMKRILAAPYSSAFNRGFTLVELMITITILAILLAVAVPSFNSTIRQNQIISESNNLLSSIMYARSEASKRGSNVSICSSSNGSSCANSTDWSTGWIITDTNGNVLRTATASTGIIIANKSGDKLFTFASNGSITDHVAPPTAVCFETSKSGATASEKRMVMVQPTTGRASTIKVSCP